MPRLKKAGLFLLLICIASSLTAQTVIQGTVTDAQTGKPLPGANVYLANTTMGSSADKSGFYKIDVDYPGVYQLVFSFIGYKKKVSPVEIMGSSNFTVNAELQPVTIQLGELSVTGSNKQWKERLARFRDEFIGTSSFAEKTVILNEEVLRFTIDEERDLLIAKATQPLIIMNYALGYKIYTELVEFKWSLYEPRGLYVVYPRFEPIQTVNEQQKAQWKENRETAFMGSLQHFLRSLYRNKVNINDFSILESWKLEPLEQSESYFQLLGRVSSEYAKTLKGFTLPTPVTIEYGNFDKVESIIESITSNHTFFVDKMGNLLNPRAIRMYGYWKHNRFARSLPNDFRLAD